MERVDFSKIINGINFKEIRDDINSFNYKKFLSLYEQYLEDFKDENLKKEIEIVIENFKNPKLREFLKHYYQFDKYNKSKDFKNNLKNFHKKFVFSILNFEKNDEKKGKTNEELKFLLNGGAFVAAKTLNSKINREITTTQFRRFYEYVLKAVSRKDKTAYYQLSSFVDYSKNRGKAGEFFYELMERSLDKLSQNNYDDKEMQNFKLFLESILGFMPKN